MERTRDDFREATAAALAHCLMARTADYETVLDLNVREEDVPLCTTPRYRERPRFRA